MRNLRAKMRDLGHAQRHTLPTVAFTIAEMAKAGAITVDDAMDLYIEYFKASSGLTKLEPSNPTIRVNASKLRQIIKAADPALLRQVSEIYTTMRNADPARPLLPLYHAMVDVCRYKIERHKAPSVLTIKSILRGTKK